MTMPTYAMVAVERQRLRMKKKNLPALYSKWTMKYAMLLNSTTCSAVNVQWSVLR